MVFNVFYRALFFVYMIFDMFHTDPLFRFTCFLHVSYRPPFFHLQVFFTSFRTGSRFSFTGFFLFCFVFCFYIFHTGPTLHSHVFYMFHAGPLFSFTCFLHVLYRSATFHLHVFYMFHTGPHFSFTCFLHVSYMPPFFHLHGFYRVSNVAFPDFV